MHKIMIRSAHSVVCPVSEETQLLKSCEGCDAFKCYHTEPGKDGKTVRSVKCEVDEY